MSAGCCAATLESYTMLVLVCCKAQTRDTSRDMMSCPILLFVPVLKRCMLLPRGNGSIISLTVLGSRLHTDGSAMYPWAIR